MNIIAGFFLVLVFFFVVGLLVTFYYVRKGMKFFKRMASGDGLSQEEFERMANKYYTGKDDGGRFDSDYFKDTGGAADGRQRQQRRTTRTAAGVTIIDDRDPDVASQKIFSRDEGEYVDFKEN